MADDQELQREQAEREAESRDSDVTEYEERIDEESDERERAAQRIGQPLEPEDR
jgi:hypothetical protein